MDVATRMTIWRTHLGLTLQVVAERAGVGHPLVSKLESGRGSVRLTKFVAIVTKGLRMSVASFFGPLPKSKPRTGPKLGRPRTWKPSAGARA